MNSFMAGISLTTSIVCMVYGAPVWITAVNVVAFLINAACAYSGVDK